MHLQNGRSVSKDAGSKKATYSIKADLQMHLLTGLQQPYNLPILISRLSKGVAGMFLWITTLLPRAMPLLVKPTSNHKNASFKSNSLCSLLYMSRASKGQALLENETELNLCTILQ